MERPGGRGQFGAARRQGHGDAAAFDATRPDLGFGGSGAVVIGPVGGDGYQDWGGTGVRVHLLGTSSAGLVAAVEVEWTATLAVPGGAAGRIVQLGPDGSEWRRMHDSSSRPARLIPEPAGTVLAVMPTGRSGPFAPLSGRTIRLPLHGLPVLPPAPAAPAVRATGSTGVDLSWPTVLPADGAAVLDAEVTIHGHGAGAPALQVIARPGVTSATSVAVPTMGRAYRFSVRVRTSSGWGPSSALSDPVIAPFATLSDFVEQLSLDLRGRPTGIEFERAVPTAALRSGTPAAQVVVDELAGSALPGLVDPVVRLYQAYFGRPPDPAGLDYWVRRRGTTNLTAISASFSRSPELQRTYGTLSNRAFVELVYRNVLQRPGDRAGVDYWTSRLDRRLSSRGQVMVGFSESSEHVRRLTPLTTTIDLHLALVRRLPSAAERERWAGPNPAGGPVDLAASLLESQEYLDRVG